MTASTTDRRTLLSRHAHRDDETLLTGGTLARAAAQGHRVVLITATAGEAGLTRGPRDQLGGTRREELHEAARRLGVSRVVVLGYGDGGMRGEAAGTAAFCRQDVRMVAGRVAQLVREEHADLLTGYDAVGGYGHPDHVMVHHVGRQVAQATGVHLLEATIDRDALARALRWVGWLPGLPAGFSAGGVAGRWTARADLTHRLDVSDVLPAKVSALAAQASQRLADSGSRTAEVLLRLPLPLARVALGTGWFVEPGRAQGGLCGELWEVPGDSGRWPSTGTRRAGQHF